MPAMTQSLEDYIEAVYVIASEADCGEACVGDVARLLKVKMPSVVKALHELKKLELVIQKPYSGIRLTAKGARVAKTVLNRHTLLREFLVSLGVGRRTADRDACLMEHILSAETIDRIRIYTQNKKQSNDEKSDQHLAPVAGTGAYS